MWPKLGQSDCLAKAWNVLCSGGGWGRAAQQPSSVPVTVITPAAFSPSLIFHFVVLQCAVKTLLFSVQSVQLLSRVQLFMTPWITARQASLSITNFWSPPKPMSIESVMPSNHLILCCPLLLLPSIFPSTRVFSNESALHSRWPKYWSFSFKISPTN